MAINMKKVLAMLSALTADGSEQTPARGRGAQEAAQAARCRRDAREAHFASDFGALLDNGGRKFKHSAWRQRGRRQTWSQYFRRDFGKAHYKLLSKQIEKSRRTTASGGWDKVYDIAKRKFFAVSMLLPQRTRSRVV